MSPLQGRKHSSNAKMRPPRTFNPFLRRGAGSDAGSDDTIVVSDDGDYRLTPEYESADEDEERLPEDDELAIPHNIIVPDRLKFAKRLELYENRIAADPVTGESKVIKDNWAHLYDAWGLGSKHIHVMERIGIDEALICPRVQQAPGATGQISNAAGVIAGASAVSWYKPWVWGPFDWMKDIGFTGWTSRGGLKFKRMTLARELGADDGWRPPRIGFVKEWPNEEDEDDWFQHTYNHLFLRIESFTKKYIDVGDIDPRGYHGRYIWLEDLPKEFLGFVKTAARQDNLTGGWVGLLTVSTYRRCLVISIIAKILEKYIFDELLFGGREDQWRMLSSQDTSLVALEGYQRKNIRAQTTRATLRGKTLTPYFWACVDRISLQLMTLLAPLVLVLDRHCSDSHRNSLRGMYQDIHAIVAHAGFFQIGLAWSHDIFRFSWPFLGQTWDLDQAHYDGGPWELSKKRSLLADQIAQNAYKAAFEVAKKLDDKQQAALKKLADEGRARRRSSLAVIQNVDNMIEITKAAQKDYLVKRKAYMEAKAKKEAKITERAEGRLARGVSSPARRDPGEPPLPPARRRSSAKEQADLEGAEVVARNVMTAADDALKTVNDLEKAMVDAIKTAEERAVARAKSALRDVDFQIQYRKIRLNELRAAGAEANVAAVDDTDDQIKKFVAMRYEYAQKLLLANRRAEARAKKLGDQRLKEAQEAAEEAKRLERRRARQPPPILSWNWFKSIPGTLLSWTWWVVWGIIYHVAWRIIWGIFQKIISMFIGSWNIFVWLMTRAPMIWLKDQFVYYIWDTQPVILVRHFSLETVYTIISTLYAIYLLTYNFLSFIWNLLQGTFFWIFAVPPFNWFAGTIIWNLSQIKRFTLYIHSWTYIPLKNASIRFYNYLYPKRDTTFDPIDWPKQPTPSNRLAKVQMVLWPALHRYSREGPLDPETGTCKQGETIVRLNKSQVVYYAGQSDAAKDAAESQPNLSGHIKEARWERVKAWVWPLSYLLSTSIILLFIHWLGQQYFPPLDQALTFAENFLYTLGRTIIVSFLILLLNILMCFLQLFVTWLKLIFWLAYALRNLFARLVGAQLTSPASGLQFAPGGWMLPWFEWSTWSFIWPEPAETTMSFGGDSTWEAAGLQFPEFSLKNIIRLLKMLWREFQINWQTRTFTRTIKYPWLRMFVPLVKLMSPVRGDC
ncbi:hypothetical protein QBC38DRAFT_543118 [Podospora fimiseda]|uniref:Uncharacterized protein n=1 Tax=Podospora fimiseda TaxID=252190 RepID=A0AAN7BUF4_9PEZI|nr:hypothetical protein QBC38DRAFT_543118 [Podospora fimiseda]